MTSCGCFEAICAYVPECNGVMVVNREFLGDTPVGMTFSTLAGSVGGGQQTPGFMGCGKVFLTRRKFLFADGGHKRLVWMPKELKNAAGRRPQEAFRASRALRTCSTRSPTRPIATDPQDIRAYMEKVGHPALKMADMARLRSQASDSAARGRGRGQRNASRGHRPRRSKLAAATAGRA